MSIVRVSPALRVAAALSPDDQAVLSALVEGHGVSASEIVRYALRWYALEGPGALDIRSLPDPLHYHLNHAPLAPPRFDLPDDDGGDKPSNGKERVDYGTDDLII